MTALIQEKSWIIEPSDKLMFLFLQERRQKVKRLSSVKQKNIFLMIKKICTIFNNFFSNVVSDFSDVSSGFLGVPFSAGEFRAGAQKDIIVNFEQQFSVRNMYGWHG